jgi:hypothetical protein
MHLAHIRQLWLAARQIAMAYVTAGMHIALGAAAFRENNVGPNGFTEAVGTLACYGGDTGRHAYSSTSCAGGGPAFGCSGG